MNSYKITAILKEPATYDERDGYGDYANYSKRNVCEIGALNEAEAIKKAKHTFPNLWKAAAGTFEATLVGA
jgi:hypothetical protein